MKYITWIDANGNDHPIKDMSEKYIKNCIKEIEKANSNYGVGTKKGNRIIIK